MKRLLITLTVLGTVLFSACEINELAMPAEKTLIKAEKGILCRGCGDWDIVQPESTTLRVASSVDTTSSTPTPLNPKRKK